MVEESAPVAAAERISALDTLRGFALLGILLMNIVAMGMYGGAYDNPTVTGGATGLNLARLGRPACAGRRQDAMPVLPRLRRQRDSAYVAAGETWRRG